MNRIKQLDKAIYELIAAGEVVENPASVVKELCENSIDAGSKSITLEIRGGGISYIRITDDGCGIVREDIPLAFMSHATSKVKSKEDLNGIYTLGFRGEALSSVAAVSKITMFSKALSEKIGTKYSICGGIQEELEAADCPKGTTITVSDIFYNTPARMKFLKSDRSEAANVTDTVSKAAVSHPEIKFRYIKDGEVVFSTNGSGKLDDAVYSVYGRDFYNSLIETHFDSEEISVNGFISKPFMSRGNSKMQLCFVNNRIIKSKTVSAALSESYKNRTMIGRFPACVLFVNINPSLVDINVHPRKTEARFFDERVLFNAVYTAAKNALDKSTERPKAIIDIENTVRSVSPARQEFVQSSLSFYKKPSDDKKNIYNEVSSSEEKKETETIYKFLHNTEAPSYDTGSHLIDLTVKSGDISYEETVETQSSKNTLQVEKEETEELDIRFVGEVFKTFLICECKNKVVVIDKHAAHERVLYDKLKNGTDMSFSQMLLTPVSVRLSGEEYSAVLENADMIKQAGFDIEDFGNNSIIVNATPFLLTGDDVVSLFTETAEYLSENKKNLITDKLDWLFANVSCRAAIKGGEDTNIKELEYFAKDLLISGTVHFCPHGRPIAIEISKNKLDGLFGRIQ